jgi:hypothetical protein
MEQSSYPYREQLLAAVTAFLEATPEAIARGKALYIACPNPPHYSIADTVWGIIKSELSDSLFQEDSDYLRATQLFLEGRAPLPRYGAERYNFLPHLTLAERACYDTLQALALLLRDFPGEAQASDQIAYTACFEQVRDTAQAALAALPLVLPADQETTYRFALRQVGALLPPMHLRHAFIARRLTWERSYGNLIAFSPDTFLGRRKAVDTTALVLWALHVLAALAGEDTLWQTWDIREGALWFAAF